jgi:hypothetical protein
LIAPLAGVNKHRGGEGRVWLTVISHSLTHTHIHTRTHTLTLTHTHTHVHTHTYINSGGVILTTHTPAPWLDKPKTPQQTHTNTHTHMKTQTHCLLIFKF